MPVTIRAPRPGDGAGMARVWLNAAAYYAGFDATHFQVPAAEGVAESFEAGFGTGGEDELMLVADPDGRVAGIRESAPRCRRRPRDGAATSVPTWFGWTPTPTAPSRSVPFYEQHMGYRRQAIVFQKPLWRA